MKPQYFAIIYSIGEGVLSHAEVYASDVDDALFLADLPAGRVAVAVVPVSLVEQTKAALLGGEVVQL